MIIINHMPMSKVDVEMQYAVARKQIDFYTNEIKIIQERCPHESVRKDYPKPGEPNYYHGPGDGSTGYYYCNSCHKQLEHVNKRNYTLKIKGFEPDKRLSAAKRIISSKIERCKTRYGKIRRIINGKKVSNY